VKEIHEGDWEHIVVNLDQNNSATEVAYYQHYCDAEVVPWTLVKTDNGTHPHVYSARGGHASFAATGGQYAPPSALPCPSRVDQVGMGKSWKTWNNVQDASKKAWYGFGGAWGDRSNESTQIDQIDNYGPAGPGSSRLSDPKVVPEGW
jgi:hypothetical protein